MSLKKKDPSTQRKKKPVNPQRQKNNQIALLLVLCATVVLILIWNQLLKPHNEKVFTAAVADTANTHQQLISQFIASMQNQLIDASTQLVALKDEQQAINWDFLEQINFDFVGLFANSGEEIIDVNLYEVESLAPELIQQLKSSFIDIDMLNKAVNNEPVFPEAVRLTDREQWLIQWAIPIINHDASEAPDAVLFVKSTMAGLQAALTDVKSDLLQIDLVQDIGFSGQRVFFSEGSGERQYIQSLAVDNSYWQVRVLPSSAFRSKVFEVPLWIMSLIVAVLVISIAPALWLILKPIPEEVEDENIWVLREKYQRKPSKTKAASPKSSTVGEADSPLDVTPTTVKEFPVSAAATGAIVNETYAVPESIFRDYDIRGIVGDELSFELAHLIGKAIASEVLAAGDNIMFVGHDARSHSPDLSHQLIQGIISTGCHAVDIGCVPTPLLNFSVIFSDQTRSGVVVTASHNPKDYNGFKMIIDEKSLQADEIKTIQQRIVNDHFVQSKSPGEIYSEDFKEEYIDTILSDVAVGSGYKVVVDAANGAASELAPALFRNLGCEVIPLFCDIDEEPPNNDSDPCSEGNLQALIEKVTEENADCGIAFDGDGDRLVVVTAKGQVIWPDQLLMLFVKDVVGRIPGSDVVFDIKSTRHLSQVITRYGGRPVMWKTGHSHIKRKMLETNALLAGEFSGHIFFKDRWFGFDDGLYAAARLLELLSLGDETLDDLLNAMPKSVVTPEIKIAVKEDEKTTLMDRLIEQGRFESGEKTLIDGLRVDFAKGWGLVRASNTTSALTLRFEADNEKAMEKVKTIFKRELTKIEPRLQLDF